MNRNARNLILFGSIFLGTLLLSEFLLRFYYVELQILMSNYSRRSRVRAHYAEFVEAAQKAGVSEETFNIYFLGESTMWGVPYGPFACIPGIVDYRLGGNLQGKPVRAINLAAAAKDATYTRYLSELLLREKKVFHPSLIVIYTGHNEFLKYHPTDPDFHAPGVVWLVNHSELARQLLTAIARGKGEILETDIRNFLDHDIFPLDPRGHDKVIKNYQKELLNIVDLAQKNNTPMIISNLVSNYASWEPNRSVFCDSAKAKAKKQKFVQAFQRGREAEQQKDYNSALKAYEEAESICEHFAEVHFRQGEVYEALHNDEKAWGAFQKAIDEDGMPIRANSQQNNFILSLKRFDHVHVVDSLTYLRSKTPNGLLDENLIVDGIHPNFEGYLLISEAIANEIHSLFAPQGENIRPLDTDTAKKIFNVDQWKIFDVSFQTGRWTTRLATWRYDPTKRLESAEILFRQAIELAPERYEGYLGLATVYSLKKDWQTAEKFLKKAQDIDTKNVDHYLHTPWVHKLFRRSNLKIKNSAPLQTAAIQ